MELFFQLVVDGLASGAIYASLALALVLIFRATRIVNFGQGEMATFSAYCAWQLYEWGMPMMLSFLVVGVFAFVLGIGIFRFVIRPVSKAPVEAVVVVTLGLFVVFQALSLWLWGSDQRAFPSLFPNIGWDFLGVRMTASAAGMIALLLCLAVATGAVFRFTRLGLAMRASAFDGEKSLLVGIPVERMLMLGWGFAAVIGFVAALLVGPRLFLSPTMMMPILLYALASATLGGWDSPLGAMIGGLIVGVAESLGATFLPFIGADLRVVIPILVTLVVLLVRPVGLFGTRTVVKL
ncbi:putative permease component of ABC transporter (plasmid) [Sinorhizobium fredii NGR234]|uniref:Branched-chain amino acid transport system permease protein LivH n=1 Tax=Sinorhizobium fredii (strain NBRC 101917 / NGR234) TaxID=394 RepID=Q6W1Y9_SINFN|nr:branched-chain amino acid ABC transporter permease [Sinorhizobium fredii]AAQ87229.1 Branched-chain amino acid transport system permease protein LivH [Sinorhizobium fredii NGR234]ACP23092.1 putative permease component of ABC transporter [Sinorhizobium fredii NGR234]